MTTLETERLVLRPVEASDADAIMALLSDLDVSRWLISTPHPFTGEHLTAFMIDAMHHAAHGPQVYVLELKDAKTFAGLGILSGGPESLMLGYRLVPVLQGQGLATEATNRLVTHAFGTLDAKYLWAGCRTDNEPSLAILAKLGFQTTEELMDWSPSLHREISALRLGLKREDWKG